MGASKSLSAKLLGFAIPFALFVACGLAYLGMNAFELYSYSEDNRGAWEAAMYRDSQDPRWQGDVGNEVRRISDYDSSQSDNYKYTRLLATYDHANQYVQMGGGIFLLLALSLLQLVGSMCYQREEFFAKKQNSISGLCAEKTGFLGDLFDNIQLALFLALGTIAAVWAGVAISRESAPAIFAAVTVLLLHYFSSYSDLARLILMEVIEVLLQINQVLRWTGTDVLQLLAFGSDDPRYQDVLVEAVLPGDDGRLVSVVLIWMIAINITVTAGLVASTGFFSVSLGFFDMFMDLAYGGAGIAAAVVLTGQAAIGVDDAPPMLNATTLSDTLLIAFPFLLLRLHMATNLRAAYDQLEQETTLAEQKDALTSTSTTSQGKPPVAFVQELDSIEAPRPAAPARAPDSSSMNDTTSQIAPKVAKACGAPIVRWTVFALLAVGSLGYAYQLTGIVMGARETDPDCQLIDELCAVELFDEEFVAGMNYFDFTSLSTRRMDRDVDLAVTVYNRTVFTLTGQCICTLPVLYGTGSNVKQYDSLMSMVTSSTPPGRRMQAPTCDCSCHSSPTGIGTYVPDDRNSPPNDCWLWDSTQNLGLGYDRPCCNPIAPSPPTPAGAGAFCSTNTPCASGFHCNFDYGSSGFCEACPSPGSSCCTSCPDAGAADCAAVCPGAAAPGSGGSGGGSILDMLALFGGGGGGLPGGGGGNGGGPDLTAMFGSNPCTSVAMSLMATSGPACSTSVSCALGSFCNFDVNNGASGTCEGCPLIFGLQHCTGMGLPAAGAADCSASCAACDIPEGGLVGQTYGADTQRFPPAGGHDWSTPPAAMVSRCKGVEMLNLISNNMTSLPASMIGISTLKELHLRGNQLTELPPEVGQLSRLTVLVAEYNALTTLPTEIGLLTELTELTLGWNELTTLPTEIGLLTNLKDLTVPSNHLTALPTELGRLTALESLAVDPPVVNPLPTFLASLTGLLLCQNDGVNPMGGTCTTIS